MVHATVPTPARASNWQSAQSHHISDTKRVLRDAPFWAIRDHIFKFKITTFGRNLEGYV